MGDKWQTYTLGQVCDFIAGSVFPKDFQGEITGEYPFIKVSDMNLPGNERLIQKANNWISENVRTKLRAKLHPAGATAFAKIGIALTYNRRRLLQQPTILDNNMMSAVPYESALDRFFFYYLLSTIDFNEIAGGTALPYLNVSDLQRIEVIIPPLSEQKAIASILGALDDKIELNRKMNETLEAMARAIFKSWFVDFDPIPGLGPHKEWQDSPLGKIPKGWRVGTLRDVVELAYGKALKEDIRLHGKIPVYGSNGQVGWHNEKLVDGPGIVVGRKGNPGIVTWVPTDFYPIDTTFYVVPKGIIRSMHYLFHALKLQDLPSLGADSAVPGLNRNMAYMNRIIVPPEDIVAFFDKQVKSLADTVSHNDEQSRTLAPIRDALLPKLLSGEIRVKDAERFVEKSI